MVFSQEALDRYNLNPTILMMSETRGVQTGSARSAASRMRAAVVLALASLPAVVQGFVVMPTSTTTTRGGRGVVGALRSSQIWETGRKPQLVRDAVSSANRRSKRTCPEEIFMGDRTMPISARRGILRGAGGSFPSLRAVVSAKMPGSVRISTIDASNGQDSATSLLYLRDRSLASGIDAFVKDSQVCPRCDYAL